MEIYRKPAVGGVHTNLSSGSMCFLFYPGSIPEIGFDCCTTTTRVGTNPEHMRAHL